MEAKIDLYGKKILKRRFPVFFAPSPPGKAAFAQILTLVKSFLFISKTPFTFTALFFILNPMLTSCRPPRTTLALSRYCDLHRLICTTRKMTAFIYSGMCIPYAEHACNVPSRLPPSVLWSSTPCRWFPPRVTLAPTTSCAGVSPACCPWCALESATWCSVPGSSTSLLFADVNRFNDNDGR